MTPDNEIQPTMSGASLDTLIEAIIGLWQDVDVMREDMSNMNEKLSNVEGRVMNINWRMVSIEGNLNSSKNEGSTSSGHV